MIDNTPNNTTPKGLPVLSASQALRSAAPCLVETYVDGKPTYFVHDEERPDRLYAEGLLLDSNRRL